MSLQLLFDYHDDVAMVVGMVILLLLIYEPHIITAHSGTYLQCNYPENGLCKMVLCREICVQRLELSSFNSSTV